MASNRYISTSFWTDTYVIDLDPTEKLLFIYLLTNTHTNIAGIYEISLRQIAFDTGIDRDMVQKILARFQADDKLLYLNGWLVIYNWIKHQATNPKIDVGIKRIIDTMPKWLCDELVAVENPQTNLLDDSLSKPIHSPRRAIALNIIKYNINTNLNTNTNAGAEDFGKMNKKTYAQAVRADEALSIKESNARNRKPTTHGAEQLFGGRHGNR